MIKNYRNYLLMLVVAFYSCSDSGTSPGPPGPVASLNIISGENLIGESGAQVTAPIIIEARDAGERPLADVTINYTSANNELTFNSVSVVTGSDGRAENFVTIGDFEGATTVTLTSDGDSQPVSTAINVFSLGADRIVYTGLDAGEIDRRLYVMNADGTGQIAISEQAEIAGDPDWSPDGSRVMYTSQRRGDDTESIYTTKFDGSDKSIVFRTANDIQSPVWSPAGDMIAFSMTNATIGGGWHIFIIDANGDNFREVTTGEVFDDTPMWSPDGSKILFSRKTDFDSADSDIFSVNADGSDVVKLLDTEDQLSRPRWSHDGTKILFEEQIGTPQETRIKVLNEDSSIDQVFTIASRYDLSPVWSPDDTQIIYAFTRSNSLIPGDLYIINADGTGNTNISANGLNQVEWDPKWIRKQ